MAYKKRKDPFRKLRQDIMLDLAEKKAGVYEDITNRWLRGATVRTKEHKSGFPAVTVDCEDIHILTDILSIEEYVGQVKKFLEAVKLLEYEE
jgi:hypothetical protein